MFPTNSDDQVVHAQERPGYEAITAKIVGIINVNRLQPGERLPTERTLSEQLGVSRTLIREALNILAASGIIQSRRGSGHYITGRVKPLAATTLSFSLPVDVEHVLALSDFRRMIEINAIQLALKHITLAELRNLEKAVAMTQQATSRQELDLFGEGDASFHIGIAEASHNPFLATTVATTFRLQRVAVDMAIAHGPGLLSEAAQQHHDILVAIREGNETRAVALLTEHLDASVKAYQQEIRQRLGDLLPPVVPESARKEDARNR